MRRSNSNLRRALYKASIQCKTQRSIVQQLDIRNNRNTLNAAKEASLEIDNKKYTEIQEQIKTLISEITKLKHRDLNNQQQSLSKNFQESEPEIIPSLPPTFSPKKYRILP